MNLTPTPAKVFARDSQTLRDHKPISRVEELEIKVNDLIDYIEHLKNEIILLEDNVSELYKQIY